KAARKPAWPIPPQMPTAGCPMSIPPSSRRRKSERGRAEPAARPRLVVKGQHVEIELSDQQHALLARSRNGVLATTGPAGSPHAAPVWYLWDGTEIRISTPRTTQKVRDIERDPRVAFVVDDQVAGEYLTLYGEAVIVADE